MTTRPAWSTVSVSIGMRTSLDLTSNSTGLLRGGRCPTHRVGASGAELPNAHYGRVLIRSTLLRMGSARSVSARQQCCIYGARRPKKALISPSRRGQTSRTQLLHSARSRCAAVKPPCLGLDPRPALLRRSTTSLHVQQHALRRRSPGKCHAVVPAIVGRRRRGTPCTHGDSPLSRLCRSHPGVGPPARCFVDL